MTSTSRGPELTSSIVSALFQELPFCAGKLMIVIKRFLITLLEKPADEGHQNEMRNEAYDCEVERGQNARRDHRAPPHEPAINHAGRGFMGHQPVWSQINHYYRSYII